MRYKIIIAFLIILSSIPNVNAAKTYEIDFSNSGSITICSLGEGVYGNVNDGVHNYKVFYLQPPGCSGNGGYLISGEGLKATFGSSNGINSVNGDNLGINSNANVTKVEIYTFANNVASSLVKVPSGNGAAEVSLTNPAVDAWAEISGMSIWNWGTRYHNYVRSGAFGFFYQQVGTAGGGVFTVKKLRITTDETIPAPGSGGSTSGQISFDFSNAIAGNLFGINASILDENYSAYTTYYIDTIDPTGAEITGFPVTFNSRTYSTGRLWTFQKFGTYNSTLKYCNMFDFTCSNWLKTGLHTIDSATLLVTAGSFNYSITTDQTNYQPNSTIRITVTNPSSSDVFVTAYGTTGVITEVAWNTVAPANQASTFTKVLPGYLPFGQYVINVATTDGYAPVVAQAKFNISAPSNTSNTLFVAWGDIVYKVGKTGIVKTTSNFNSSTLTIKSPGGTLTSYGFPANSTNTTGINLNEEGLWKARITDNGNASNFIIATTEATKGNPEENETIAACKDAATYVCWDKKEYTQGQAYILSFRVVPKITDIASLYPYIEITNPSGTVVYNQSVNFSYDRDQAAFIGSLGGSFSPQASLGIYFARLKNRNILGEVEIRAESAAILNAGTATVTPTPNIPDGTTNLLSGNFILIILVLFAFLGVGYEIGDFMGAALGFGSGFIVLGVIGVMPVWALFLFGLIVITGFAVMAGKQITGK